MKKILNPTRDNWNEIIKRPVKSTEELESVVKQVFAEVKRDGDQALKKYTHYFDRVDVETFEVSGEEVAGAGSTLSAELKDSIELARKNITTFHKSQVLEKQVVETTPGVQCWQEARPIQKVGIYIPGGSAPLFSTVLMLGIPAVLAGCEEIILCTPPNKEGKINPAILYTAQLIGIKKIYAVGGIQAIGALTYGTETVPRVYKIFGPGNQYVTTAKQVALSLGVSIDMPAGPSELLVIADESVPASFVASDLLSQAEHGADSQVVLVTNSEDQLYQVQEEIDRQLELLPRKEIAAKAIENSRLVYLNRKEDILELVNEYAPEHLIVCSKDEDYYLQNIINAGSVFIGAYTPESAGDYASGTNHTLPTNGFAKAYSGVNMDAFTKKITFQRVSEEGIRTIGPAIETMAEQEGLQAHKYAVTVRLNKINNIKEPSNEYSATN